LLIAVTALLFVSIYINVVLYKRLVKHEDEANQTNESIFDTLETLKLNLERQANIVNEVAGYEVVSNEPYVKRVVAAVVEAHNSILRAQESVGMMTNQVDENE